MFNLICKEFSYDIHPVIGKYLQENGWTYIGVGSFRQAFRRKDTVIKVPRNHEGFEDNITEAYAYRKYRNNPGKHGIIYAPCRLLPSGCLMMPFVQRESWEKLPDWAQGIDGGQAGYHKGRLVGYDTGYDSKHENKDAFQWAKLIETISQL